MNAESGMARSVCGYAKAESSAIGITLGRRMAIKRRYRNCTFWNCSSHYTPPVPSSRCFSLARRRSRFADTVAGKRARLYMRPRRGWMMVRREWGKGNREDEPSLFSYSGIDPTPPHHHELSSTPGGMWQERSCRICRWIPRDKGLRATIFYSRALTHREFYGIRKIAISRYQIQSVPIPRECNISRPTMNNNKPYILD